MAVPSIFITVLMAFLIVQHHSLEAISTQEDQGEDGASIDEDTGLTGEPPAASPEDLVKAIEEGDLSDVKHYINEGVDVNHDSGAALVAAIKLGHIEIAETLLEAGADPDGVIEDGSYHADRGYPLYLAAKTNSTRLVDLLLEAGAAVNASERGTITGAAENGHLGIVKKLLEAGFDPNTGGGLRVASGAGHLDVVKTLLEAGARITYSTPEDPDESPLHQAMSGGHVDVIEALVEYGADINAPYAKDSYRDSYGDMGYRGSGWTVMHLASRWGFRSELQKLIDLGAEVNAVDDHGYTPLHIAAVNLKLEVVKELLKLCADWNFPNGRGETALDLAKMAVSADYSELPQPSPLLQDIATKLLKEKVKYYPYTEAYMKELAKGIQDRIQANKTMMEKLESETPSADWSSMQVATRRVFEDKAINGLLEAFEVHGCKLTMGHHLQLEIGSKYLVKCECLKRKAKKLTITHFPKGKGKCPSV